MFSNWLRLVKKSTFNGIYGFPENGLTKILKIYGSSKNCLKNSDSMLLQNLLKNPYFNWSMNPLGII